MRTSSQRIVTSELTEAAIQTEFAVSPHEVYPSCVKQSAKIDQRNSTLETRIVNMKNSTEMSFAKSLVKSLVKSMASIKLAVVVILAIATVTAWGTFVEAEYDATAAQKLVYHSVWMYGILLLLSVNLIGVMIDRWPWKQRHTGFVLAHIGILTLLGGSIVTRIWGVDGSMSFGIGEKAKQVIVGETDLTVYTSMDGSKYSKLFDREVDFFLKPPSEVKPVEIGVPNGTVKIIDYLPYSFREQKIVASQSPDSGAAVRFQIQNEQMSVSEWLVQAGGGRTAVKDLGPAQVVFTGEPWKNIENKNAIVLRPRKGSEKIDYEVYTAREPGKIKRGTVEAGGLVETGWRMNLVMRILKFMPQAKEEISFKRAERPTPLTTASILVDYNGERHWMSVNSILKLFSDQAVYVVAYANRRIDAGIELRLKDFKVGRYQGTLRAASYESLVELPDASEQLISMNEPLKFNGYTFYQASFEEDPETGKPTASVLSVNFDPGRWIKYLGSLLIVLGTIHLFYFKTKTARAAKKANAGAVTA